MPANDRIIVRPRVRLLGGVSAAVLGLLIAPSLLWRVIYGPAAPHDAILLICIVGLLLWSAWQIFGGTTATLDLTGRRVTTHYGLGVALRTRRRQLGEFSVITITPAQRHLGRHRWQTLYRLHLRRRANDETHGLLIFESPDYRQARQVANDIARRAHCALVDAALGDPAAVVSHEPGKIDEPVRERAQRLRARLEWPASEPPRGCLCERAPGGVSITVAGPSARRYVAHTLIGVVLAMVFGPVVILGIIGDIRAATDATLLAAGASLPDYAAYFTRALTVLAFSSAGVLLVSLLRGTSLRDHIRLTSETLEVERVYYVGRRTWRVPLAELSETWIGPAAQLLFASDVIYVRGGGVWIELGSAMARGERLWLRDAIMHVAIGGEFPPPPTDTHPDRPAMSSEAADATLRDRALVN
jgi:hypothetical protein